MIPLPPQEKIFITTESTEDAKIEKILLLRSILLRVFSVLCG